MGQSQNCLQPAIQQGEDFDHLYKQISPFLESDLAYFKQSKPKIHEKKEKPISIYT